MGVDRSFANTEGGAEAAENENKEPGRQQQELGSFIEAAESFADGGIEEDIVAIENDAALIVDCQARID